MCTKDLYLPEEQKTEDRYALVFTYFKNFIKTAPVTRQHATHGKQYIRASDYLIEIAI